MAEIRPMTNDDLLAYQQLCSICYTYRATETPDPLPEEKLRIRMGAFNEEGQLLSAMMQIPYDVRFEGESVKLLGIGGVVTDPCARRGGAVRKLFEEGLPRLYREGYVFSALYPFSHRFYRKFGYETAEFWHNAELPRTSLRSDLEPADEIVRALPDGDDQDMRAVYERYAADKHLVVLRDDAMWADLRRGTPWADLKYAYIMKKSGKAVAYWVGTMQKDGWRTTLTLKDFAWTCPEGLEAVFAMIRGMNEVESVVLRVQGGFDPRNLVEEPYDVDWKNPCDGMVRVMNVERALVLLPAPPLPGMLHIRVTDAQIPQNNGVFVVNCDGYGVSVTRDDYAEADIACDIRGLAVLMCGQNAFGDCVRMGAVTLKNEKKRRLADLLFGRRELHMNHNF